MTERRLADSLAGAEDEPWTSVWSWRPVDSLDCSFGNAGCCLLLLLSRFQAVSGDSPLDTLGLGSRGLFLQSNVLDCVTIVSSESKVYGATK